MSKYDLSRRARLTMSGTGIVGAAAFFLAAFSPNLPMYGDSLVDYGPWARSHQADAHQEIAILFLAYLLYMLFGVYVATLVGRNDPLSALLGRIALVAVGVRFAIEVMHISVLIVGASNDAADFGASMAVLGAQLSVLSLVPYAILLLAIGMAAKVSGTLPTWLAWFTLAVGVNHGLAMVMGITGPPPLGPGLIAFGFIWFTSIPAWPFVTGVALVVSAIRSQSPARHLAPSPS